MSDENVEPNKNEGGQTQPTSDPNQQKAEGEWFVPQKFKTADDMKKSYDELEKTHTEQSEKLKAAEGDLSNANSWINTVYNHPQIKNMIDGIYKGQPDSNQQQADPNQQQQPQQQQQSQQQQTQPDSTKMEDIDLTMRGKAIQDFDSKYSIKEDEKREIHKQVGQELSSMGYDFKSMPLNLMGPMMDKAFRLAYSDRYQDKAKREGAAQAATNMQATVPTQGGGSIDTQGGKTILTPEQKNWSEKLGKDPAKVAETVDKMDAGEMK